MNILSIGIGILIIIFSLQIVAMGQLLLAIRQISLNTGSGNEDPQFQTLKLVAKLNNVVGWVGLFCWRAHFFIRLWANYVFNGNLFVCSII